MASWGSRWRSGSWSPASAAGTSSARGSATLIENPLFERFIIAIIVLNAITLGCETSKSIMARWGTLLHLLDELMLMIFVAELAARMFAYRWRFWRDPWAVFDFVVVGIALLPATGELSVLRALRILRALRLITAIPSIRKVVGGLLAAVPSMGSIILLLVIINYVFAVMSTKLFGADFEKYFGTLGDSFFTYFQIMTLEGWSQEIVRPVMEKYPWSWVLFVPYIILATFMVLNLFIGIVVDVLQQQNQENRERVIEVTMTEYQSLMAELGAVRQELRMLKAGHDMPPMRPVQPIGGKLEP